MRCALYCRQPGTMVQQQPREKQIKANESIRLLTLGIPAFEESLISVTVNSSYIILFHNPSYIYTRYIFFYVYALVSQMTTLGATLIGGFQTVEEFFFFFFSF